MSFDKTRHQSCTGEVDRLCFWWNLQVRSRTDALDAIVADEYDPSGVQLRGLAVENLTWFQYVNRLRSFLSGPWILSEDMRSQQANRNQSQAAHNTPIALARNSAVSETLK